MAEKFRRNRRPHIKTRHDLANAFGNVSQKSLLKVLPLLVRNGDLDFFAQRFTHAHCSVDGLDGKRDFIARDGGFAGSNKLLRFFRRFSTTLTAEWNERITSKEMAMIVEYGIHQGNLADGSTSARASEKTEYDSRATRDP